MGFGGNVALGSPARVSTLTPPRMDALRDYQVRRKVQHVFDELSAVYREKPEEPNLEPNSVDARLYRLFAVVPKDHLGRPLKFPFDERELAEWKVREYERELAEWKVREKDAIYDAGQTVLDCAEHAERSDDPSELRLPEGESRDVWHADFKALKGSQDSVNDRFERELHTVYLDWSDLDHERMWECGLTEEHPLHPDHSFQLDPNVPMPSEQAMREYSIEVLRGTLDDVRQLLNKCKVEQGFVNVELAQRALHARSNELRQLMGISDPAPPLVASNDKRFSPYNYNTLRCAKHPRFRRGDAWTHGR